MRMNPTNPSSDPVGSTPPALVPPQPTIPSTPPSTPPGESHTSGGSRFGNIFSFLSGIKKYLAISAILVIAVAVPLTTYLAGQQQDIRQEAAQDSFITASPTSCTIPVGSSTCAVSIHWNDKDKDKNARVVMVPGGEFAKQDNGTKNAVVSAPGASFQLYSKGKVIRSVYVAVAKSIPTATPGQISLTNTPTPIGASPSIVATPTPTCVTLLGIVFRCTTPTPTPTPTSIITQTISPTPTPSCVTLLGIVFRCTTPTPSPHVTPIPPTVTPTLNPSDAVIQERVLLVCKNGGHRSIRRANATTIFFATETGCMNYFNQFKQTYGSQWRSTVCGWFPSACVPVLSVTVPVTIAVTSGVTPPTATVTTIPTATTVPTVTLGPTATEAPTPTIPQTNSPDGTKLAMEVFLQGIGRGGDEISSGGGNPDPYRLQRPVAVELYDTTNVMRTTAKGVLTYNETAGDFIGVIEPDKAVPAGAYTARVLVPGYLAQNITKYFQVSPAATIDMAPVTLITGDVNQDNILSILDYNILLGCYSGSTPAKDCDSLRKRLSDINDDGAVNGLDYNVFVRNLSIKRGSQGAGIGPGPVPTATPTPTAVPTFTPIPTEVTIPTATPTEASTP